MRLHQILTGSCNDGWSHASYGTLGEFSFIAYASGCDVVILNENFVRVQLVPGSSLGSVIVSAVSCSKNDAKIAISNKGSIFVLSPIITDDGMIRSDLSNVSWCQKSRIHMPVGSHVCCLSWSSESTSLRCLSTLLSATTEGTLIFWRPQILDDGSPKSPSKSGVRFGLEYQSFDSDRAPLDSSCSLSQAETSQTLNTTEVWTPIHVGSLHGTPCAVDFSPDGRYFATLSRTDDQDLCPTSTPNRRAILRIWFRNFLRPFPSEDVIGSGCEENWEEFTLSHPSTVTSYSWRRCGRYVPTGWFPNVLITSAEDRVCRIWIESLNPRLGAAVYLDEENQSTGLTQWWSSKPADLPSTITLPLNQSHLFDLTELRLWKSEAFVTETSSSPQRRSTFPLPPALLRHPVLRHFLELWLTDPFADVVVDVGSKPTVEGVRSAPATTTTYSCPQFALATTLCLDNFRGLALGTSKSSNTEQFVVHWLDNKAYRFDSQLKNLLLGCMKRIFNTPSTKADEAAQYPNQTLNLVDSLALLDKSVVTLISEWQHDPDVVISVHPTDGSLIAWYIHGLDTCVPNPSGICTQPLPLLNGSNRPNFLPSTFIVSPSLGTKLTQVTTSLRSKLNGAFTVAEAASLLPKVFLFPLAVPQNCHHFQMLLCNASQNGSLSSDIGVLFCRLLVLYNALELLASHGGTVHTGLPGGITDTEQHSCKLAIMRDITEIQLLCSTFGTEIHRSQYVAMVTRHVNGSLRYWRLDLSESNRFQWILSINGSARLSGHRFHTEAILPHPLVPLLLTTSHFSHTSLYSGSAIEDAQNSHSELILWRAGPIGPLTSTSILPGRDISQCQHSAGAEKAHLDGLPFYRDSAGVTFSDSGLVEVARITVSHSDPSHTWFSDLAWFPCTLTTSLTVYPMVLFLGNLYERQSSTDQLGFFLAFLDAKDTRFVSANRASTPPSDSSAPRFFGFTNSDTSGCVIQLPNTLPDSSRRLYEPQSSTISETLLLHVFPIQLVHTSKYKPLEATFERGLANDSLSTFMVVRLTQRKTDSSSTDQITYRRMPTLEMWRVNVRTQPSFAVCPNADRLRVDNLHILNDIISGIQKVCDCDLSLPKEVYVVMAAVSAADVSWVSLFDHRAPPPYLIMSACSDGCLRFWRCDVGEAKISYTTSVATPSAYLYSWLEWRMPLTHSLSSSIELNSPKPPEILDLDCAYSGRIAVAYIPHDSDGRVLVPKCASAFPSVPKVLIAVYEFESSGGCEWVLEDTIDLSPDVLDHLMHHAKIPARVQLAWINAEDGGHMLSVILGSSLFVYAATCQNTSLSSLHSHSHTASTLMTSLGEVYMTWKRVAVTCIRTLDVLQNALSAETLFIEPRSCGRRQAVWLREGILIVGQSAEIQVYSQWPGETVSDRSEIVCMGTNSKDLIEFSKLDGKETPVLGNKFCELTEPRDETVAGNSSIAIAELTRTYSAYMLKPSASVALLSGAAATTAVHHTSTQSTESFHPHDKSGQAGMKPINPLSPTVGGSNLMANLGLFESIQLLNPTLPQFHPRQLLEWLNLGRIRRVQTILAHLTRCLAVSSLKSSLPIAVRFIDNANRRASSGVAVPRLYAGTTEANSPTDAQTLSRGGNVSHGTDLLLEPHTIPPVPLYVLLAVESLRIEDMAACESGRSADLNPLDDDVSNTSADESPFFRSEDENDVEERDAGDLITASGLHRRDPKRNGLSSTLSANAHRSTYCPSGTWSLKPSALVAACRFEPKDARLLSEYLSTRQLPGLSPLDQMYLLGIADLMANTQPHVTERQSSLKSTTFGGQTRGAAVPTDDNQHLPHQDLDECGLRFLMTVQLYSYLSRTLPPARRAQLLSTGLSNASLVWAFHSSSQEELISRIPAKQLASGSDELTWSEFKRYGCGWWIVSDTLLRLCAEKIARSSFQASKDPMDSVPFYLAMHKAKVVAGLFKSIGNKTLENFFRSNFDPGQPACRQAKLNAFRLLSQHKYPQAAGLFLLAGCIDDAIRVCLDALKDLQLAVVLIRLYTSTLPGMDNRAADAPYPKLLREHVTTDRDPFLRSMAYWTLGDPLSALQTLLEGPVPDSGSATTDGTNTLIDPQSPQHPQSLEERFTLADPALRTSMPASTKTGNSVYPNVFKFYTFLRAHPLVVHQWRLSAPSSIDHNKLHRLAGLERRLYFRTAHHYSALGCPMLALEVLSKIHDLIPAPLVSPMGPTISNLESKAPETISQTSSLLSANLDTLGGALKTQSGQSHSADCFFTWSDEDSFSKPTTTDERPFKISINDEEVGASGSSSADSSEQYSETVKTQQEPKTNPAAMQEGIVDLIANQLKFIACLKILSEELSTLAACAEAEGAGFRLHVWHWLEHELAVVRALTTSPNSSSASGSPSLDEVLSTSGLYNTIIGLRHKDSIDINALQQIKDGTGPLTTPSLLLSVGSCSNSPTRDARPIPAMPAIMLSSSSLSPELRKTELNRLQARHSWLKAHESFLASLINFCGLYGASGVGLSAVRIELLLLLTELYTFPAHPRPMFAHTSEQQLVSETATSLTTFWPTATIGLVDGIPLLRSVLHLSPDAPLLHDPVKYIQCMIQDLVGCLETLPPPYLRTAIIPFPHQPKPKDSISSGSEVTGRGFLRAPFCAQCADTLIPHRQRRVFLLRNLCASLAICVHQSLCIGGWFGPGQMPHHSGAAGVIALPASSSMTSRSAERLLATLQPLKSSTEPSKWPGLSCLRNYILEQHEPPARKGSIIDDSSHVAVTIQRSSSDAAQVATLRPTNRRHLIGLLAEALAATYLGLLVYALHFRDACVLYRLACVRLDSSTWSKVFGGAYRAKPFRPSAPPSSRSDVAGTGSPPPTPPSRPAPSARSQPSRSIGRPQRGQRHNSASEQTNSSTGSVFSHTSSGDLARARAIATQEVAKNLSGPPTDQRTSQRIRFLAHAEAASLSRSHAIQPEPNKKDGEAPTASPNRPPPPPPDEWFVPPQCSIITCLMERPSGENATPDDPSRIFDSDDSDPPAGYESYTEALAARQRRTRRTARRLRQEHMLTAKREAQRKTKEELRRRLAKRSGFVESNEEVEMGHVSPTAQQEADMNSIDAELEQPPSLILRLLHLDPDFYDLCLQDNQERVVSEMNCGLDTVVPLSGGDSGNESDDALPNGNTLGDNPERANSMEVDHQWTNGDSFAWRLMRLGLMQIAKREITRLTQLLNFGDEDLAVYAPGLVKITWLLDTWTTGYSFILTSPPAFTRQTLLKGPFDAFDSHLIPPPHFIPDLGSVLTDAFSGKRASEAAALMPSTGATRALLRLRHLIDPSKTPFQTRDPFSLPAKRLWCHLVRQPYVDDMITRHVFRRPRLVQCLVVPSLSMPIPSQATQPTNAPSSKLSIGSLDERPKNGAAVPGKVTRNAQAHPAALSTAPNSVLLDDAIRLIHKEQEPLMAMCVNQVTYGCVAVATPKELIELNTENLVTLPAWFADEVEYDLELMRKPQPRVYPEGGTDDFITLNFVNLVGEHAFSAQSAGAGGTPNSDAPSAHVILKRTLPAVYSLAAHPMLPYYLAGTGMGSIHLYEWGTVMPVVAGFSNTYSLTPSGATGQYPAGSRGARVTALRFDDSGRRFGCGDADGYFGLWNTQTTAPQKPPYFRCKCHAKGLADFCFVGCSTLIATAGNGCAGGSLLTGTVASSGQIGGGDTVSGTGGSFFYGADQDGANLTLWDTLMSPTRCGVIRVTDPELEAPCTSVAYLAPSINCSGWPDRFLSSRFSSNGPFPSYSAGISLGSVRDRVVVVGTKRGDVCYVDLRKPKVLLSFSAHESAVRALCVDTTSDCLITGGADGNIKIWRLSDHELMISFPADFHQGRGAAAVAAAALFRGNQSAAIIAATNPGVSEIRLLPLATEASLLTQSNLGAQSGDESIYQQHRDSVVAASTACRFLSCGADGGLRMRSYVMRPRPFNIC